MILSASNTLKPTTTTILPPYTPQLTCNSPIPRSYDKTHGVRPRRNVRQAMKTEVSMYACVQKDDRGLDMAVEDAKYRMSALLATHRTATCR